jgi:hypothetical protein
MNDIYDTNFQWNSGFFKICTRYSSNDHFSMVDHLALVVFQTHNMIYLFLTAHIIWLMCSLLYILLYHTTCPFVWLTFSIMVI